MSAICPVANFAAGRGLAVKMGITHEETINKQC